MKSFQKLVSLRKKYQHPRVSYERERHPTDVQIEIKIITPERAGRECSMPFNLEQYNKLLSCADKDDLSEWNKWVRESLASNNTGIPEIKLAGADLAKRNLKGVELQFANLKGANLRGAILNDANLEKAKLGGADLREAHLNGADLTGVGLSGARIDPKLHTQLLRNIRKMQWEKWYVEKKILPFLDKFFKQLYEPFFKWFSESQVKTVWHMFESLVMRGFWWISNYGTSTKRIIGAFFFY